MYVKSVSREKFLKSSFKEASRINDLFLVKDNTMSIKGSHVVGSSVQKYLYESSNRKLEEVFKNLLLEGCIRSETISGGCGDLTFSLAVNLFIHLSKKVKFCHPKDINTLLENKEKEWIKIISDNRTLLNEVNFKKLLKSYFKDAEVSNFVKEIIKVSGCDNSIFININ